MDKHTELLNILLARGAIVKMRLGEGDEVQADKDYEGLLKWFKENYEIKRK